MHRPALATLVLSALAALLSVDCSSGSTGTGGVQLRPNVATVYTGRFTDEATCASPCFSHEDVDITDVDRDGDRVAVLITDDNDAFTLAISEDAGKNWTAHAISPITDSKYNWDNNLVGVHLTGGQIYLLFGQTYTTGLGAYSSLAALRIDPATWTAASVITSRVPSGRPWKLPNGHLRTLTNEVNPTSGSVTLTLGEFDVSSPEKETLVPCSGDTCRNVTWWSSNGGQSSFDTFSANVGRVCFGHYELDLTTSGAGCLPQGLWPGPINSIQTPILYDGTTAWEVWSSPEKQAFASTFVIGSGGAATSAKTVPLGAGFIAADLRVGRGLRPRFGGFQILDEPNPPKTRAAQGRLVTLSNGPWEATFHGTPCADESNCGYLGAPLYGYRLVQWILPWAPNDYLVFWVVQSEATNNQQTIYAAHETPTLAPITVDTPDGGVPTSPIPGYPDADPMTQLEKQCAFYSGCGFSFPPGPHGDPIGICVSHFANESSTCPGIPAQRDAFLAATDCPQLFKVFPNYGQGNPAVWCPSCGGASNCTPAPPPCYPTACVSGALQSCVASENMNAVGRCDLLGVSCDPKAGCVAQNPGRSVCGTAGTPDSWQLSTSLRVGQVPLRRLHLARLQELPDFRADRVLQIATQRRGRAVLVATVALIRRDDADRRT